MKKLLVLLLALAMVFSLAACGGGSGENGGGGDSEGDLSLTLCLASEPATIDPALNSAVDGAIMLNHSFEGLIKWIDDGDGNAKLAPGMAESWDVSDDGTVYTFHLREDALWSDGEPVTAYDFEYSWKRLVEAETAADYSYMLDCVLNAPEIIYDGTMDAADLAAVALDEHTFEVTLHTAIPYFIEIAAFPATFPVRQDVIEEFGDQWTFDSATYISNGPYTMTEWSHNAYILMEKNEYYYDVDALVPETIKFALMDDDNAILAAFNAGEIDYTTSGQPVDEIPTLLASGQLKINDYIGTYYVCFQTELAPFDDPLVRKAFSLAIDREYITSQITKGGQVPASGFVPAGVYDAEGPGSNFRDAVDYYDVSSAAYEANVEEARALMAEAGYPNGEGFPIVEYLYNTHDAHRAIGEALQDMWKTALGVTVTLDNQDWGVFLETRKNGDYQIARHGWIADYNDPISFMDMWITGGGNNDAQYANPEYDALIRTAKSSADANVRMKAMHDAEDILMGEAVVAPIYFYTNPYMVKDDLKGWYYTPLGYSFFGYAYK